MLTQTIIITFENGETAYFIGPANQADDTQEVLHVAIGEPTLDSEINFEYGTVH